MHKNQGIQVTMNKILKLQIREKTKLKKFMAVIID